MKTDVQKISIPNYEKVIQFENKSSGLKGIIAIHSTKLGPSLGGVRMRPYKNEKEALHDVLRLSRAMTYKAAAANLPLGGGKCVLFGNPQKDKNEKMFLDLGEVIQSLKGAYLPAEDSGTSLKEMQLIRKKTKYVTGANRAGDPSPVTALGVFQGIGTLFEILLSESRLNQSTIAIQGLGNVGFALAKSLHQCGVKLIVADTNPKVLEKAKQQFQAKVVDPEKIFDQKVDVFAPCAYGGTLNKETIARLKCKIVAGAANNQFEDEKKDPQRLHERGIWHAPDYIINSGGIINLYCEYKKRLDQLTRKMVVIPQKLREVITLSEETNTPPFEIANRLVEEQLL